MRTTASTRSPFSCFYSMFGFQRIGDLIWAFADPRGKGFLMGGTAGRTTLLERVCNTRTATATCWRAQSRPAMTYDPAFAYEIAVIVQDGIRRMYEKQEDRFYYITMYNENYAMPPMPEGVREGILKGLYPLQKAEKSKSRPRVQLFGSGADLQEALRAQQILAEKYDVTADVWSVTSYNQLRRDALTVDRWNRLHPQEKPRRPYLDTVLEGAEGPIIAMSDYMKIVPDQIAPWLPGRLVSLGTDGFGRSDDRTHLRRFFEVDAECVTLAALHRLAKEGAFPEKRVAKAVSELKIDPEKADPMIS